MNDVDQYENAVKMATDMARAIKEDPERLIIERVLVCAPLQLLYVEMAKRKEIKSLSELSSEEKKRFWDKVKDLEMPKYRKIWCAQALYVYELITEKVK